MFRRRVLHVDLTTGRSSCREIDDDRVRLYLGGVGLGTSLLVEYAPPGVEPLSPANPLIFTTAPLVGTPLTTTAKFAVVTKSPLTGFIADSLSSSHFALALKGLGVDGLVITGQASSMVYLFIRGLHVEIRPAEHLRGRAPNETETSIRSELACPDAWVASIGAAGERLVRFATISNEGRHAGRGGAGAVMGSKNLKAIAAIGDLPAPVARPRELEAIADSLRRRSTGPPTDKYRTVGTVANLAVFNRLGTLPTRNFRQATFEGAESIEGESLTETHFRRRHGCASCTIGCERMFSRRNGGAQRLEYETVFALGPLCGVGDADSVLEAAALCDRYGLDSISTGATIAWAIETAERGLLPQVAARGWRFGGGAGVLEAIHAIAARDGVGSLLAEGTSRASKAVGQGSDQWAMHVKGLELPGYDPRSLKTLALGLAVNPRGACHNRSGAYEADFSGEVDRFHGDASRGALVVASEDFAAVLDSLIVCKFLRKCFTDFYDEAAQILSCVTGWDYSALDMRRAGARIHTLKKCFNIREGWQPSDDWLPARVLNERVPAVSASGAGFATDELRDMIRGYYRARQWDDQGFVPDWKLRELDITSAARSL